MRAESKRSKARQRRADTEDYSAPIPLGNAGARTTTYEALYRRSSLLLHVGGPEIPARLRKGCSTLWALELFRKLEHRHTQSGMPLGNEENPGEHLCCGRILAIPHACSHQVRHAAERRTVGRLQILRHWRRVGPVPAGLDASNELE